MRQSNISLLSLRHRCRNWATLAVAASAVVVWSVENAQAAIYTFELDAHRSYLTFNTKLTGPAVGGVAYGVPQQAVAGPWGEASNKTHYFGQMSVDIRDTTIQLLPGASINAYATGAYAPADPQPGNSAYLSYTTPGTTPNANYGLAVPQLGMQLAMYRVVLDNGWQGNADWPAGIPSTPMTLSGTQFNLAGQAMEFKEGNQAIVSVLGNTSVSYTDPANDRVPFVFFGTAASDIGTWDWWTNTLTLPVHSSYTYVLTNEFGGISQFVDVEGQLVLHIVPEPKSSMLLSAALVGLAAYAWHSGRDRRRTIGTQP